MNAERINFGLTRAEHGTLMGLMFGGYWILLIPAKSAAA
jgi:hypothetical protein